MAATRPQPVPRKAKPAQAGRAAVPTDAVFTIDELAIYLKLPKRTLYKLAQEGTIPGHKVGRHWRFHREVIDRWLGNTPHKEQMRR
ncbi:MAG: helix-turn-helix domain-containing protein [Phycisphaeraceae bacterium]|nr:helix-turn-helix domain-containing protein [Phycisphaeraceae bacterium]